MKVDKICSCGARLRFVDSGRGLVPINVDSGKNHFLDCPDKAKYKRRNETFSADPKGRKCPRCGRDLVRAGERNDPANPRSRRLACLGCKRAPNDCDCVVVLENDVGDKNQSRLIV